MTKHELHLFIKSRLQKLEEDPNGTHLWDGNILGDAEYVEIETKLFQWLDNNIDALAAVFSGDK